MKAPVLSRFHKKPPVKKKGWPKGKPRGKMTEAHKQAISEAKKEFYNSPRGHVLRKETSSLAKAGKIGKAAHYKRKVVNTRVNTQTRTVIRKKTRRIRK